MAQYMRAVADHIDICDIYGFHIQRRQINNKIGTKGTTEIVWRLLSSAIDQ